MIDYRAWIASFREVAAYDTCPSDRRKWQTEFEMRYTARIENLIIEFATSLRQIAVPSRESLYRHAIFV
jgi:hypothetical protein